MQVEVALNPAEIALLPTRDLSASTCVVFDVLRATSTMLTALAHGAARIYPVSTVAAALAMRQDRLPHALLGGERHGLRLDGFDLGNSPHEYTEEAVRGRDLIMTTTNGTVALQACAKAETVYAGALLNLDALARVLNDASRRPRHLCLVCAGSGSEFALEDAYAAAALLFRLQADEPLPDAARLLVEWYQHGIMDAHTVLKRSSSGRRLAEIGLDRDVEYCARVATLETLAVMRQGALEQPD